MKGNTTSFVSVRAPNYAFGFWGSDKHGTLELLPGLSLATRKVLVSSAARVASGTPWYLDIQ
jgi:hypothetical protein